MDRSAPNSTKRIEHYGVHIIKSPKATATKSRTRVKRRGNPVHLSYDPSLNQTNHRDSKQQATSRRSQAILFASKQPLPRAKQHQVINSTQRDHPIPRADARPSVAAKARSDRATMLELLVGCSSVVLLLHGASLFLRSLFGRHAVVARPISFLGFVA